MSNQTYEIAGETFDLRPYTRPVKREVETVEEEMELKLQKGEIDEFEYYAEVLKTVLEGNTEVITADTVEGRRAEEIVMDFLPESRRIMTRLTGF